MKLHANAALSLNQRRPMVGRVVEQGWSLTEAAEAAEVSGRTCSKWVRRYVAEGEAGPLDRSSAPSSIPHRTPEERVDEKATSAVAFLRRAIAFYASHGIAVQAVMSDNGACYRSSIPGRRQVTRKLTELTFLPPIFRTVRQRPWRCA